MDLNNHLDGFEQLSGCISTTIWMDLNNYLDESDNYSDAFLIIAMYIIWITSNIIFHIYRKALGLKALGLQALTSTNCKWALCVNIIIINTDELFCLSSARAAGALCELRRLQGLASLECLQSTLSSFATIVTAFQFQGC